MWFEILPSIGIVGVCLFLIPCANMTLTYLSTKGHTVKRHWCADNRDFMQYLKDERLTGSVYKQRGLEAIPDAK